MDMDENTIQRLNEINRQFYEVTASEFDQTRGTPWLGWKTLVEYLPQGQLSVLDVGCGNGRFGVFLAEQRMVAHYHGVDNNPQLLKYAADALKHIPATLEMRDVVQSPPDVGYYDVVVAFGLLHHIPSYAYRKRFMQILGSRIKPGGVLIIAAWCFYEFDRFRARIIPWQNDLANSVEAHDYLLDWRRGQTAWRYCHYVDEAEHAQLIRATGLQEIITYRADGFTNTVNRYSILKRN
ncbi:MAG: class I SAM-dependent methyltransferase [Phototrophicales bacterium]